MYIVSVVLIALIAILLSIVVLLQSGKGGGLAGIAAGGQTTQILGARQAPDFLEKATWTLGTAFIVLCIVTSFFADRGENRRSIIESGGGEIEAPVPVGGDAVDSEGGIPSTPAIPEPAPADDAE